MMERKRMMKIKVYFAGVDEWNRPVFRSVQNKHSYYCDVVHLVDYKAKEEEVLANYAAVGTAGICYKGTRFDSEPMGDPAEVELVTRKEAYEMLKEQEGGQQ